MHYVLRPGIVRVSVCGVYLLIPNREASLSCPYVQRISIMAAAAIENIEKGLPVEKTYEMYRILSKQPENVVREKIDAMLHAFYEKGFLIRVEDKE